MKNRSHWNRSLTPESQSSKSSAAGKTENINRITSLWPSWPCFCSTPAPACCLEASSWVPLTASVIQDSVSMSPSSGEGDPITYYFTSLTLSHLTLKPSFLNCQFSVLSTWMCISKDKDHGPCSGAPLKSQCLTDVWQTLRNVLNRESFNSFDAAR